jgi:hypothetical protein
MKQAIFCFFLLSISAICRAQQDTIIIKNIKQYQEGKINILRSPKGKMTIVRFADKSSWKEKESLDSTLYWDKEKRQLKPFVDTTFPSASPLSLLVFISTTDHTRVAPFKSYVDPNLTAAQKNAIKANECINAKFAGLSRSKVKTSIVSGNSFTYSTMQKFLNTLPPDVDMEVVIDDLDKPWKDRAIQEMKNATLKNIYLKAYKREEDNDYHLILTDSSGTIFFNAEVSALPATSAASYQTLKTVRNNFNTFPGSANCGGSYVKFDTPIRIVKLKGSIFFDSDHAAGTVGPTGFRPKTAWEIHPVTFIEFE